MQTYLSLLDYWHCASPCCSAVHVFHWPGQGLGPAPRTAGRKFIAESGAGGTPLRASAFDSLDSNLAAVRGGALAAPGPPAASGCGSACGAGAPGGCGTACSGALHGSALAEYHWTIVKAVR